MSDDPRLLKIAEGLAEIADRLDDDPGLATSARRLARVVEGVSGLPGRIHELASAVVLAPDGDISAAVHALRDALTGSSPAADRTPVSASSARALVVESDPAVHHRIEVLLTGAGFEVVHFDRSAGVAEYVGGNEIDLLVVDIFLIDRDGRDLILELSQLMQTAELPIIAIAPAGERTSLARSECLALGADEFLVRSELEERLPRAARVLARREKEAPPPHDREGAGLLRRARFADRFADRPLESGGGVLALVAFDAFRDAVQASGQEAADRGLAEIARALEGEWDRAVAVGRWATSQIGVLAPGANEVEAATSLRTLLRDFEGRSWSSDTTSRLARSLSVAIVPAPAGSKLEDRVQSAGLVRLGLSSDGTRILASDAVDGGSPRVVVVEDDAVTRALVTHKLRHAGFEVTAFEDGDRASEAFPSLEFDLALLDINLPGKDGFQLIREIRDFEAGVRHPILVLSSMGSDDDVVRGLELGADDYMLKPFSPVEMTARVRRLLGGVRLGRA